MDSKDYITKKYVFGYSTGYVNGTVEEEVELQLPTSIMSNKELLNNEIEEAYQEWLCSNVDTYWYAKEEEDV